MMEVLPNPSVYQGSQKEGNSCTVSVPCFKVWCLVLHLEGFVHVHVPVNKKRQRIALQRWKRSSVGSVANH